jgi:DNA-binding response OmpR family regulator
VNKKILIADDDRNLVKLLVAFLSPVGYEIRTAHDGATALRIVSEYRPDLVLLDVMMPVVDGYNICKTLTEDPQYNPAPKVIIMTSRNEERDERISRVIGADVFINKPFKPGELTERIRELLGG